MEEDVIIEKLERLGYTGNRAKSMLVWLSEMERRKSLLETEKMTLSDVAVLSIVFDAFVSTRKES